MKLRASAGRVGNDNLNIDQWKQLFDGDKGGAIFGGNPSNGISPKQYGLYTPYLTWQKSNSYNVGMDVRLLQGHLVLGTDYYYRFTYDLFERRTSEMPTSLGINTSSERLPQENHGEMEVRGVEIELGYNNNFRNEVTYYIKGHFSWDKRKILKKIQNPAVLGSWKDELLTSPDHQQGLICLGVLNTQAEIDALLEEHPNYRIYDNEKYIEPQLGMLYYQDVRGNKYTDSITGRYAYTAPNDTIHLEWDRTIIAEHNTPPFNYGFSFGLGWRGIRLDMFFTGAFGHKVFVDKEEQALPDPDGGVENVFAFWNDYWSPDNPDAAYPRPYNYGFDKQYSTFWMRDGHTLRLTTLNINYTLPKNISDRLRVQKLRVYFTGRNLWTVISPFDFKDPSVDSAYDYPMMKLYNFGVNITI
jgi:hypothetical protein